MSVWKSEELPSDKSAPIERKFIPDMTDDQLRQLAREKLSEALQAIDAVTQPEMTRKLCAEVKDRLDGKPGQSITSFAASENKVDVSVKIEFVKAQPMIEGNGIVIENTKNQ